MRLRYPVVALVLAIVLGLARQGLATEASSGTVCGINAVYASLRLFGREVCWSDLVKPEYMSSPKGSLMGDLVQAIDDHGLFSMPIQGLSAQTLSELPWPIIINVKKDADSMEYNHWVLIKPRPHGWLLLFDAPNDPQEIRPADLAGRWRGVGLIVADRPISPTAVAMVKWTQIRQVLPYLLPLLLAAILVRAAHRRDAGPRLGRLLGETAGLIVAAGFVGMTYHFVSEDGLLSHGAALETVARARFSSFLARIDASTAQKMAGNGTAFIDARMPDDYALGHVPGALNIPLGAPAALRRTALAAVPRDATLVVYCQSSSCPYAAAVAKVLADDGYKDLLLFTDGWVGWQRAQLGRP